MNADFIKQKIQIVTIAENQLLLLQFAPERGDGFQNITGSVEEDENFLEGARRELVEEIGVAENLIDMNLHFNFRDRWGFEVEERVFLFHPDTKPEIHLSAEHQSYKWIPIKEVNESDFAYGSNFLAFKKALEFCQ